MSATAIILTLVFLLLIYLLYKSFTKTTTDLSTTVTDAKTKTVITADQLPAGNNTQNYTYSIWFYVNDWNYKYGEPKIVFGRTDGSNDPSPSVVLAPMENNLAISIAVYADNSSRGQIHTCNIANVPLQKWVNLIVSLNGRSVDIYLDGKLVRTCVLPGVAKVNNSADVFLTPDGGFDGWTSGFQYIADAINPQQAWNIYKAGYGSSPLGNFFNKYRIKVAFLEDNQEQSSFEI